jgi:putative transposase
MEAEKVTSTFVARDSPFRYSSSMPRTSRAAAGGIVYHVLNRGNGKMQIFRKPGDYHAFLQLLIDAKEKANVELFGFCLMPNHWHLVLRPRGDRDLAAFMSWLTNTHVKRYRAHYKSTSGHLYQGRYKSFPVKDDDYFLTLLRYVEANPLRAKLADSARLWPWSSLGCEGKLASQLLDSWPVDRPRGWAALVDQALPETRRRRVRDSIDRGRPLGDDAWTTRARRAVRTPVHPKPPRKAEKKAGEMRNGGCHLF